MSQTIALTGSAVGTYLDQVPGLTLLTGLSGSMALDTNHAVSYGPNWQVAGGPNSHYFSVSMPVGTEGPNQSLTLGLNSSYANAGGILRCRVIGTGVNQVLSGYLFALSGNNTTAVFFVRMDPVAGGTTPTQFYWTLPLSAATYPVTGTVTDNGTTAELRIYQNGALVGAMQPDASSPYNGVVGVYGIYATNSMGSAALYGPFVSGYTAAGGTTTNITAAAAFTSAGTGGLTGLGSLLGTSALTSSGSTALSGTGQIFGATSATSSQSGAVSGVGRLIGGAGVVSGGTGSTSGTGSLTAATPIITAASATILGSGTVTTITATTPLTTALTGSLTGRAALFASTSITTASTGLANGIGALLASASLSTASTATASGLGTLYSTTSLVIGITGTIPPSPGSLTDAWATTARATASWAAAGSLDPTWITVPARTGTVTG